MNKIKLVCFDVDGTLVEGTSWLLLTEGLDCSPQEHLNIFQRAKNKKISFIEGERMLTKMYQDSSKAAKPFIKSLFAKTKPRSEAKNLIFYLKKKGYPVYLISGAIDIYVEAMANKLKTDGFYANSSLEFDKKNILKKIHYRDNQGEVKLEQLKKLTQRLGITLDKVAFIGDSENDIEVFKKTKHGIAINCFNEDLKRIAWKTVGSLKEIKKIL